MAPIKVDGALAFYSLEIYKSLELVCWVYCDGPQKTLGKDLNFSLDRNWCRDKKGRKLFFSKLKFENYATLLRKVKRMKKKQTPNFNEMKEI